MADAQTRSDGFVGPRDTHDIKMTGDGEPGSHSAVFGLTPDGRKDDNTSASTSISKPAHSKETAVGGGTIPRSEDGSSNNTSIQSSGADVASQMDDPRVAERGHGGTAVESLSGSGGKPGAGVGGPEQGTGDVTGQGGGMLDKAKSYVSGS